GLRLVKKPLLDFDLLDLLQDRRILFKGELNSFIDR
ncbi:MAG: hypothetical protein QOI53_3799, partial [Verrucomicrobiota bacterium]|nr:hypothetical protein [Verrucomicrobiota bacterium]